VINVHTLRDRTEERAWKFHTKSLIYVADAQHPSFHQQQLIEKKLASIAWSLESFYPETNEMCQYIALAPSHQKDIRCILIYPHGGPHSCFTTSFDCPKIIFALLGYFVILINYRGSTSFGQHSILKLVGKCGELDVSDCIQSLEHAKKHFFSPDKSNNVEKLCSCYFGGSHGGFLGGHLLSRELSPRLTAAVLRNPVTNIATMIGSTDIPDWCVVESGAKTDQPEIDYETMYRVSPMSRAHLIKAPTLIMLGDSDRRVPPSQGLELYHKLKSLGVETEVKVYPGCSHAISKVDYEGDSLLNAILWFEKHNFGS